MTTFEKLQAKLKNELELNVVCLRRTYAKWARKNAGGFIWIGHLEECSNIEIGGCQPASEYVKKGVNIEIDKKNAINPFSYEIYIIN